MSRQRQLDPPFKDAGFSLYSTDSEDQVASAHRGLDRCAALLRTLLSPEKDGKQEGRKARERRRTQTSSNVGKASRSRHRKKGLPPLPRPQAKFPGASKHSHGSASTTPTMDHRRTETEPSVAAKNEQSHCKPPPLTSTPTQLHKRAVSKLHQRIQKPQPPQHTALGEDRLTTEKEASHTPLSPPPPPVVAKETTEKRKRTAQRVVFQMDDQPPTVPVQRCTESAPAVSTPAPPQDQPPLVPPPPPLYPSHPFPWLYYPPPTHAYAPFCLLPQPPHPGSCMPPYTLATTHSASYPDLTRVGTKDPSPRLLSRRSVWLQDGRSQSSTSNQNHSSNRSQVTSTPGGSVPLVPCSPLQRVESVLQEMLHSFQLSVASVKEGTGNANASLYKQLEDMEQAQKSYQRQLYTILCTALTSPQTGVGEASTADWLSRLHEVEMEKTHLLDRVIKTEMAYSDTKALLEHAERRKDHLQKELESQRADLRLELQQVEERVREVNEAKHMLEQELEQSKQSSTEAIGAQVAKTLLVQERVQGLEQLLASTRRELSTCKDDLFQTKNSLETAQEELQMMKLSVSEKETELLQAQDKLLGVRQCLAYFLSKLTPLDGGDVKCQYLIPGEVVEKVQSLVSDGDVNSFLAVYAEKIGGDVTDDGILCDQDDDEKTLEGSPSGCSSVGSRTDSVSWLSLNKEHSQQAQDTTPMQRARAGGERPDVIITRWSPSLSTSTATDASAWTSVTTSSEQDFRRNLASLDAEIARLQMQFRVVMQSAQ